jgi:SagB-type dehydrogenase family enzyme
MSALFVNPYLFFLIDDGQILAWDYKKHNQYELSERYFSELLAIARSGKSKQEHIQQDLQEGELISSRQPEPQSWGWDVLSKIFHIGTQDVYDDVNSLEIEEIIKQHFKESAELDKNLPPFFLEKHGQLIDLPDPDIESLENASFFSVLKNRKTSREFNGNPITLSQLSTVLYSGFGLIHGKAWDEFEQSDIQTIGCRKASPASGALHAEEVYIFSHRVTELENGIYHYRPQDHKLTQLARGDYEDKIIEANYNQFYSKGLACGIYLTCRFDKLWWKYKHSRSLKVALLDLGHASQTFLLSATALNLKTWMTAAFQDSIVNELIQVDGSIESAFLFIGLGHGTNQAIPEAMLRRKKF